MTCPDHFPSTMSNAPNDTGGKVTDGDGATVAKMANAINFAIAHYDGRRLDMERGEHWALAGRLHDLVVCLHAARNFILTHTVAGNTADPRGDGTAGAFQPPGAPATHSAASVAVDRDRAGSEGGGAVPPSGPAARDRGA